MIFGNSVGSVGRSKLPQHVLDVCFDGPFGHEEADGDLRVRLSLREAAQHIPLTAGQRLADAAVTISYADGRLRAGRQRGRGVSSFSPRPAFSATAPVKSSASVLTPRA